MLQVGWASASSTVTSARSSAPRPRNGPPDAVSTIAGSDRRVPSPARRHWCTAQCSLSTGTSSAPGVSRTDATTGPAAISDSLLASASRLPAASVASVTGRPANPTTPFTATSASTATAAIASGPASMAMPGGSSSLSSAARSASASATTRGWTAVGLFGQRARPTTRRRVRRSRTGPTRPPRRRGSGSRWIPWSRGRRRRSCGGHRTEAARDAPGQNRSGPQRLLSVAPTDELGGQLPILLHRSNSTVTK